VTGSIDEGPGGPSRDGPESVAAAVAAGSEDPVPSEEGASEHRWHPDIYYIVLDRYGAGPTLRDAYGFDNRPFLRRLRDLGFFVAGRSVANYPKTTHSLASTLSMEYLDGLAREMGPDSADRRPLHRRIVRSPVSTFLRERGYTQVHVGSWWRITARNPHADVESVLESPNAGTRIEEWERVRFQLDEIRRTRELPGSVFVFAHILVPHPPYVFDREGNYVGPGEEVVRGRTRGYVEQVEFINDRMSDLFQELLNGPADQRPVVVLQSDEGPHPPRLEAAEEADVPFDWTTATPQELGQKLRILNAYYLPRWGKDELSPRISPVNTFRLILRRYFGAPLAPLPDETYVFRDYDHPYDFIDVTDRVG
jgi:hypothetical protein